MTRRLFLRVLLGFGSAVNALAAVPWPFTDSWDASGSATHDFSLDLVQSGQHLSGYHSAVAQRGNRLDAVLPNEGSPSITGTIAGRLAHVRFQSGYDQVSYGEALLTLKTDGSLAWKITKSVGTSYLPAKATLHRQTPSKVPNHAL